MQTLTITQQDYIAIADQARRSYENDFQIDFEKNGCVLYISINHIEKYRTLVGASFIGFDELIGECIVDRYEVTAIECQDCDSEIINHNFKESELCKLLN